MVSLVAISCAILAILGYGSALHPNGILYPFEIDSLLTCHVENPLAGLEGQPPSIPEPIPQLPFDRPVTQEPHDNVIWLPSLSRFRIPNGAPNQTELVNFLGADFDPTLTSIGRPSTMAPRGCEIVPAAFGSGGVPLAHIATAQDPTPWLDRYVPENVQFDIFFPTTRRIRADPSLVQMLKDEISINAVRSVRDNLVQDTRGVNTPGDDAINDRPSLCQIHTAKCPLSTVWAELPSGYFPKFFAQGTCSNKNCSFPRSKLCEEDFSYVAYVTVLRWDCCFNYLGGQVRWDCGWRKVRVPMLCDCTCACGEVFHTP